MAHWIDVDFWFHERDPYDEYRFVTLFLPMFYIRDRFPNHAEMFSIAPGPTFDAKKLIEGVRVLLSETGDERVLGVKIIGLRAPLNRFGFEVMLWSPDFDVVPEAEIVPEITLEVYR